MEETYTFNMFVENYKEVFGDTLPSLHTLLWSIFLLMLFYAVIHIAIFVYHWSKYNIAPGPFLRLTYIIYFSGIAFFSVIMFLSLIAILT